MKKCVSHYRQSVTYVYMFSVESPIYVSGLEIRVDRWPESTENPVGPPIEVRQWSGGVPKLCQQILLLLAFLLRLLLCSLYLISQPSLFIRFSSHLATPFQTFLRTCTLNKYL